ncbi:hypothetical protein CEXT_217611 [Caerostris extrusa]|uniref:Uncharacterized protein n=1 Tax=Caerostris extrusa TaxID=172846 RepID=A0AAV4S625_CAEEX|nr:hypothetical protein CEXT_217611 [Caerostris extrusa]
MQRPQPCPQLAPNCDDPTQNCYISNVNNRPRLFQDPTTSHEINVRHPPHHHQRALSKILQSQSESRVQVCPKLRASSISLINGSGSTTIQEATFPHSIKPQAMKLAFGSSERSLGQQRASAYHGNQLHSGHRVAVLHKETRKKFHFKTLQRRDGCHDLRISEKLLLTSLRNRI